ncbi:hypothetical protein F53441_4116 [Fusarium austroafricanum]|uniref:Glycosyltransferase family 2 protein n=1 Tax=Fusarium austroafricanum TaxID=2364996 RepID=A0A8H4NVV0_9HYPO|nr:hypothetical protein F53441_4116 [Fusarium austroafricanum]
MNLSAKSLARRTFHHIRTRLFPSVLMLAGHAASLYCVWAFLTDIWTQMFATLFILRYTKLPINIIAVCIYWPSPIKPDPAFSRRDVTVILPTLDPHNPDFRECVESILANDPACLLVVTVGGALREECLIVLRKLSMESNVVISVAALPGPNKRRQIAHAMPHVTTPITILADDHVFWPVNFLPSVLAPFEDVDVGMVATRKHVRRTTPGEWSWPSIVNLIACCYLQRHNWELCASNALDGGVFVISGRTAAYRTEFLNDADLLQRFCHEKFFFGRLGGDGLGPDDDNFLTREAMKKGWRIRFQATKDATIETTFGEWPKFKDQLVRWARTTFRSNPVMLRDPRFMYRYPWTCFMVYWNALFNFAILWWVATITCLIKSDHGHVLEVIILIEVVKIFKIGGHFYRHPRDLWLIVFQLMFGYVHGFIKLWALVTFWDCDWSGRNLDEVHGEAELDTTFWLVE